jgi:hypothetical protein
LAGVEGDGSIAMWDAALMDFYIVACIEEEKYMDGLM